MRVFHIQILLKILNLLTILGQGPWHGWVHIARSIVISCHGYIENLTDFAENFKYAREYSRANSSTCNDDDKDTEELIVRMTERMFEICKVLVKMHETLPVFFSLTMNTLQQCTMCTVSKCVSKVDYHEW